MAGRWAACLFVLAGTIAFAGDPPPHSARNTPVVRAVKSVRGAVANIHSQKNAGPIPMYPGAASAAGRMSGMGTGVVVDPRGYIVTNHHVVEDVSNLRVTLVDGSVYPAEIVARDPKTDLALIRIYPTRPLPVMNMGNSSDVMIGETVIAVGNAFGYEHTTTVGYVSELHRDVRLSDEQSYRDLIQTDAAINPGNSGGPLVNLDGEMIGLNVAIRAGAQNIGFAIPVNEVKRVLTRLMSVQKLRKIDHGMSVATVENGNTSAVEVKRVDVGGPAETAGLASGDRIAMIDGFAVSSSFDLERLLLDKRVGDRVAISFVRDGTPKQSTLVLGMAKDSEPTAENIIWRRLGIKLSSTAVSVQEIRKTSSASLLNGGLRIVEIAKGGPADAAGIRAGDIFVGLEDRETLSLDHIVIMLKHTSRAEISRAKFWLVRDGKLHYGTIDVLSDD